MNTAQSTLTLLSTAQWLDWYLLQKGQMYTNTCTELTRRSDGRLGPSYETFAAPFRSLVWDSGVSGAQIFNAVSGYIFSIGSRTSFGSGTLYSNVIFPQVGTTGMNGGPLQIDFDTSSYISVATGQFLQSGNSIFFTDSYAQTGAIRVSGAGSGTYDDIQVVVDGLPPVFGRGASSMMTDFVNGRAIFPTGIIPQTTIVSGAYAVKDFNVYFANQGAERAVYTDKYYLNSRFGRTKIPPAYDIVTPCIFVSASTVDNVQLALGGKYDTQTKVTLNVLAETSDQLNNALSLLAASRDLTFPQLPPSEWPLSFVGDYKSGYNYMDVKSRYQGQPFYSISDVRTRKVSDTVQADEALFIGTAELTLHMPRFIR